MTIGERLEEARKRKGVSIREAAEATKIRGEYLMSMEDNSLDIPLPEIYKRGFLRNYARFLKLDPDKILTDYDAQQIGRRASSSSQRESIGRVDLPDDEDDDEAASSPRTAVADAEPRRETPPPPTLERDSSAREIDLPRETDNSIYVKAAVVIAGFVSLIALLVLLISLISREPAPDLNPELADQPAATETATTETPARPATTQQPGSANEITLTATDNVTVIVEQTSDRQRLWQGTLNAGETIQLEKQGPVSIRFTNGAALTIEAGGQQLRPNTAGVGRTLIQ